MSFVIPAIPDLRPLAPELPAQLARPPVLCLAPHPLEAVQRVRADDSSLWDHLLELEPLQELVLRLEPAVLTAQVIKLPLGGLPQLLS